MYGVGVLFENLMWYSGVYIDSSRARFMCTGFDGDSCTRETSPCCGSFCCVYVPAFEPEVEEPEPECEESKTNPRNPRH